MIDAEDVGNSAFAGLGVFVVFLIWYLVFSVPEIEECHKKGGQIVRIENKDTCMDTSILKPIK